MVAILTDQDDDYVDTISTVWGKLAKKYETAVGGIADDDAFQTDLAKLMEDVETMRIERHRLAHSVIALERQEGWSVTPNWLAWSPKVPGTDPQPLAGPDYFTDLLRRIGLLTVRTIQLQSRAAKRLPPHETPTASQPTDQDPPGR